LKFTEERVWTDESIDSIAMKYFPNINREEALKRPILNSALLSQAEVGNCKFRSN